MALIPIADRPEVIYDMEAFKTTDPAYAGSFNDKDKQLLENDKSLNLMAIDAKERINLLELMFSSDVTGNPFLIDFVNLDGLEVTGTWNESMARVEF